MNTPEDVIKQIEEVTMLLSMAQRLLVTLEASLPPLMYPDMYHGKYEEKYTGELDTPTPKKNLGSKSPYLKTNMKQMAQRRPNMSYEELSDHYGVSMKKVVEILGVYRTKKEIEDAEAKTAQ